MNCEPQTEQFTSLPADPCDRLAMVETALYRLASGQAKVQVRYGNYWVQFAQGSVTFLERERSRLSLLCSDPKRGGVARTAISIGRRSC